MVEGLTSGAISEGQVAAFAMAVFFRGLDDRRARRADAGHARQRHRARLGPARPGGRQAFDRRRRRQRQPDAGAGARRLRRLRADDLRPRPRPHRRHARQVRRHPRLRHPARRRDLRPRGRARSAAPSSARPPTSPRPTGGSTRSATSPAPSSRSTSSPRRSCRRSSPPGSTRWSSTSRPAPAPSWRRSHDARALADALVEVATGAGCPTRALITDMNEPLATAAGNALEVANAARFLRGEAIDGRLYDVTVALGGELLAAAGLAAEPDAGADADPRGLRLRRGRRALRPHGRGARRPDRLPRRLRGASRRRAGDRRRHRRRRGLRHRHRHPRARPRRGRARRRPPPRQRRDRPCGRPRPAARPRRRRSSRTRRSPGSTPPTPDGLAAAEARVRAAYTHRRDARPPRRR